MALQQIEREKGIPREFLVSALEQAMGSAYRRKIGEELPNLVIKFDLKKATIQAYLQKVVVESPSNPELEISPEAAKQQGFKNTEIGDTVEEPYPIPDLGRLAAQAAKQVMLQKLREAEDDMLYEEFKSREGQIVSGLIHRREGRNIYVDLAKIEGFLPRSEQVPFEAYRFHERYQFLALEIRKGPRGPTVVLSRQHPELVLRLFEREVPEIQSGAVQIRSIAREPGYRTKIAVHSTMARVDPVGACVGTRGTRVQPIVDELRGEKIDIIRFNPNLVEFLTAALSPAAVHRVTVSDNKQVATVIVPDDQLSLAIGKGGQNVRLASKLCNVKIDIYSVSQYEEKHRKEAAEAPASGGAPEPVAVAEEPRDAEETAAPKE